MMMEINENYESVIVELDEDELEEVTGGKTVVSTGNGVRVRMGPGTEFGILGKVKKGDTLVYDGRKEKDTYGVTWYRVRYKGGIGWICSKYSSLRK